MKFDHLIVLVHDLEKTAADFAALGFSVVSRADTRHGSTRFRFISFHDGSYILLTAFADRNAQSTHRLGPVLDAREGWADYSFTVEDATALGEHLKSNNVPAVGPVSVSNRVSDLGEWSLDLLMTGRGASNNSALPFVISDHEGRDIRIPGPSVHANGANGLSGIRIATSQPQETKKALELMGAKFSKTDDSGNSEIRLVTAGGWINLVEARGDARDEGLVEAVLSCTNTNLPEVGYVLDLNQSHGAAIRLCRS